LLWLLVGSCISFGAELTISVRYPDKTPAKGVKVHQLQLERPGRTSYLLGATDEKGEIKAKFEEEKSSYENLHGYGVYRYVVMPENYRWEVSDLFYRNKYPWSEKVLHMTGVWPYEDYKKRMSRPKTNWSVGKLVQLKRGSQIRWEVSLNKGRNVEVSVVDQFNKPVRNKKLSVSLDLEALSHTGRGGEIPMYKVWTDDNGRFDIANAGIFFYSFDLQDHRYCAPDVSFWTGIARSKFEQDKETLVYHKCIGKSVTFVVTDKKTGNPIPEARIFVVKLFPNCRQGGPFGYTDINGEYISRKFYTEHVIEFGVAKDGYEPWVNDIEEFVAGKTYKISLEPKSKK